MPPPPTHSAAEGSLVTFDSRSVQSGHWKANILTRHGSFFLESIAISSGYQASPIVMLCRAFLFQVSRAPAQGVGNCFWSQDSELGGCCVYNWCGLRIKACFSPTRTGVQKKKYGIGWFLAFALDHWRFYGLGDVGAYYGSRKADRGGSLGKSCLILTSLFQMAID